MISRPTLPRHGQLLNSAILLLVASLSACSPESPTASDVVPGPLFAKPGSGATVISIRAAFAAAPLGLQSDDGTDYVDGSSGVLSQVGGPIGDWVLEMAGKSSTRSMRLNFGSPVEGNPGTAPFASEVVKSRLIAKAVETTPGSFAGMTVGQTINSPLSVAFSYGGLNYGLRMNPANHPVTQFASVTCTGAVSGGTACGAWTVVPTGADGTNLARLEIVGRNSTTFVGYFRIGFGITLSQK